MVFHLTAPPVSRRRRSPGGSLVCLALALCFCTATATGSAFAKEKKKDKAEKKEADEEKAEEAPEKSAEPAAESEETAEEEAASGEVELDSAPAASGVVGPGNTIFFIDAGLRSDLGTLLQRDVVGRFEQEENFDVKSVGPLFHVGLLTKLFWQFRLGVGLGYGFNYTLKERLTQFEEEQEQEPQVWVLGQLHTVDLRLEFSQHLADAFWLVATPRGGLSMIAVGEDLKRETDQYEDSHVVRQGPRLGLVLGGDIGIRYMLTPWFSFRVTGGYAYTMQSLLKASRRGDAADSDHVWRTAGSRVQTSLGAEASF